MKALKKPAYCSVETYKAYLEELDVADTPQDEELVAAWAKCLAEDDQGRERHETITERTEIKRELLPYSGSGSWCDVLYHDVNADGTESWRIERGIDSRGVAMWTEEYTSEGAALLEFER